MIVKVTKKHIKNGDSNSKTCPIALALIDKGKKYVNWLFFEGCHLYNNPNKENWRKINIFIKNFDYGYNVRPFQFEMKHLRYKK